MSKSTLYVLIVIFSLGIIGAIIFIAKFSKIGQADLIEGDGDVSKLASGEINYKKYENIARSANDSLKDLTWQSGYFGSVADLLMPLSNNELRLVSNAYLNNHGSSDAPTLKRLLQDEWVGSFGPCTNSEIQTIGSNCFKQKKLVERLSLLGL